MLKTSIIVILALAFAGFAQAQTDALGGLLSAPTSGHPDVQSATCSQSTTTITCTVTDGTKYRLNEPMIVSGTSTAMDTVPTSHQPVGGVSTINSCTQDTNKKCTSSTLTLAAPASNTVTSTSGTIAPERWYAGTITSGRMAGRNRADFEVPAMSVFAHKGLEMRDRKVFGLSRKLGLFGWPTITWF